MSGHGTIENVVVAVQDATESLNLQQAIDNLTINTNEVTNGGSNLLLFSDNNRDLSHTFKSKNIYKF
jgi:hypothetical protein